jgi:hypothetical protein
LGSNAIAPWGAAAAAALMSASCTLFFGLDDLSGGACDGGCEDAGGEAGWRGLGSDGSDGPGSAVRDGAATPDVQLVADAAPNDASTGDESSDGAIADGAIADGVGPDGVAGDDGDDGDSEAGALGTCSCVGAPPPGWSGPVALWEGAGGPPGCSGDYSARVLDAFDGLDAPAAACTCTCGAPSGASCGSSLSATLYSDHGCTTPCDSVSVSDQSCANVHGVCNTVFGVSAAGGASGGHCSPQSSSAVPPATWGVSARACELPGVPQRESCAQGEVCIPPPAAPMQLRPCVFIAGDVSCPSGSYSVRHRYYRTVSDSRGCAHCSCGAPSGVDCAATLQEGCGQTGPTSALPTSCASLSDPGSVVLLAPPTPTGGSCAPSGGAPSGSASPASPVTVCCLP